MTLQERDFLVAAPTAEGSNSSELVRLLAEQTDYLADIAIAMRKDTADILTTAVVTRTSQLNNQITDLISHEVRFELAGKPVPIYRLLAFSSYTTGVVLSLGNLSGPKDGIIFAATTPPLFIPLATESLYIQAVALTGGILPVNGPTNLTDGGFFLYGFTIPDYYRIRNASRS